MLPAFLITFREVIEASLIVATILGILVKLKRRDSLKTVWLATFLAIGLSVLLLIAGSIFGFKLQEIYTGPTEELIEGILMISSALFITWAVFFLHNFFGKYKTILLSKIRETVEENHTKGLFGLVFLAVFREGFEIVLFLATIYLSDNPGNIFAGFIIGIAAALVVSAGLFIGTLKLPVYFAFRITSLLLILFAGGLLARGVHEFSEFGVIPEIGESTLFIIPESTTFAGSLVKGVFGITKNMNLIQILSYSLYVLTMTWWIFLRRVGKEEA